MIVGAAIVTGGSKATRAVCHPIGWSYFDLFRFWCPLRFVRRGPIERLHKELRTARARYQDQELYVIAHSFGTYALTRVLLEFQDIVLDGLILCGSVVPADFPWNRVASQLRAPRARDVAINECGTRDIWPPLAQSSTWGYGASGTYGFGTVDIQDRIHRMPHSGYFDTAFVRAFWVPFVRDGTVAPSETQVRGESTPGYFWLFNLPLRWLILATLVLVAVAAARDVFDRFVPRIRIETGEFECAANNVRLKNCSVSKIGEQLILSFDGPDAEAGRINDRYTGALVADGKDLVVRLANHFNPNPTRPEEGQQGPASELRLRSDSSGYAGQWVFGDRTAYRFSMSKKETKN